MKRASRTGRSSLLVLEDHHLQLLIDALEEVDGRNLALDVLAAQVPDFLAGVVARAVHHVVAAHADQVIVVVIPLDASRSDLPVVIVDVVIVLLLLVELLLQHLLVGLVGVLDLLLEVLEVLLGVLLGLFVVSGADGLGLAGVERVDQAVAQVVGQGLQELDRLVDVLGEGVDEGDGGIQIQKGVSAVMDIAMGVESMDMSKLSGVQPAP